MIHGEKKKTTPPSARPPWSPLGSRSDRLKCWIILTNRQRLKGAQLLLTHPKHAALYTRLLGRTGCRTEEEEEEEEAEEKDDF